MSSLRHFQCGEHCGKFKLTREMMDEIKFRDAQLRLSFKLKRCFVLFLYLIVQIEVLFS